MSHRQIDAEVLNLDDAYSRGYQSMGILHYIGLTDSFKGLFSGMGVASAVHELRQQNDHSYDDLIAILSVIDSSGPERSKRYTSKKLLHNC